MNNKNEKVKLGFTTIQHDPRLRFDLSNNDYCIADVIYNLSNNPSSICPGWCYASRGIIGAFFGISRQSVSTIVKKLEKCNLVEVHNETKYLRTTQLWYDEVVTFQIKKSNRM